MKNGKMILFIALLVIVSLSCNFLFPTSQSHIPGINNISQSAINLPVLDPEAPLPSPGAAQLRTLPAGGSDISTLIGDLEAAEQAAMKAVVADLKAQMPVSNFPLKHASLSASPFGTSAFMIPSPSKHLANGEVFLLRYYQSDVIYQADGGLSAASVIGFISSMFTDIFNIPVAFPTKSFTQTETKGDATTNMNMEIGRSEDGSNHFGLGLKSDGAKNGVSVKTDLSATIDGQRCPTAEGQVSFSIKARLGSESGGTGITQDLTTFVRALVNDDAEIASSTFDVIQGTTQVKGGRQVYVETGETIKFGTNYTGFKESNWRVDQKTDNATQEDFNNLESAGLKAALDLGLASLISAEHSWQSGGCTKIVAASPGTVQPGSTTAIPVNVISTFDGSNAPSKIKVALTGAESIDPTSLTKTPGTLSYTASNENGKSATILLTAASKRGKAKLELTANTGGTAYHIFGSLGDFTQDGYACPATKSFTIPGTVNMKFTPTDGNSGSVTYSGGPFGAYGDGSYTIGDGGVKLTIHGCIVSSSGTFCNDGAGTLTATPIDPATCVSQ